ncbi:hypothetical protein SCQ32_04920 [Streptococcus canis]|uniref:hypothetical protein n=1 Tax=Streptococcus canis TaxID=1329 RepID=UPI002998CA5A|nr:hypothetical protein [Streptococcus canis]
MTMRIYSKHCLYDTFDNAISKGYEEGERSIDFLFLVPITDKEQRDISERLSHHALIRYVRWRFNTLMITTYLKI